MFLSLVENRFMYYKKVVFPILKYAAEACAKNDIKVSSNFTTNGVLLTPKVIKELNSIALSYPSTFQITLDGNREMHNSIRFASKKAPTYDTITKNIREALIAGNSVSIRFNYAESNIDSFVDVLEEFKDLTERERKNVRFNFQQVWQNKSTERDTKKKASELVTLFQKSGFSAASDTLYQRHNCYADAENNIVINYNGDVFKCTAKDFDTDGREGVLNSNGTITWNNLYEKRMAVRYMNSSCKKCSILPLCNGGCSQNKLDSGIAKDKCYRNMSESDKMEIVSGRLKQILVQNKNMI